MTDRRRLRFEVSRASGQVSALLVQPSDARALYVFGHGAGADMEHDFMEAAARGLAERGVATFRYNFPYMESGKGWPPSPRPVLMETVRSAVEAAREAAPELPLFAGGKSMGGRMTSLAAAEDAGAPPGDGAPPPLRGSSRPDEGEPMAESASWTRHLRGLVFFGFPLHTKKKASTERADHLARVSMPMLFLQGTRDKLAQPELLTPVAEELGGRATLHLVEGADHGFHVLKRSGRTDSEVLNEMLDRTTHWMEALLD